MYRTAVEADRPRATKNTDVIAVDQDSLGRQATGRSSSA
jgi:hypothetical protein